MERQETIFQLYLQRLTGTLSPEEESYVQQLLASDPRFREEWALLEAEDKKNDIAAYLDHIDTDADLTYLHYRRSRGRYAILKRAAVAAAVLLAVSAGSWFLLHKTSRAPQNNIAAIVSKAKAPITLQMAAGQAVTLDNDSSHTITVNKTVLNSQHGTLAYTSEDTSRNLLTVPAGNHYKLLLSDGTEVWLNAATTLRFPFRFGKGAREVYVSGEAYFKVAKDAARPFIVHTPLTTTEVLGTAFNINTYTNGTVYTSLTEGSVVNHGPHGERQELHPGYQSAYGQAGFSSARFDTDDVLAWMNGVYYFHKMPLATLAAEASRFYGVTFIIDKPEAATRAVTGLMDRDKLPEFLSDLHITAQVECHLSGSEVHLK
ncbi:FecR family protein [Chitinophaga vietnamensis]|uniref:FecR family protein n=1 Tax=Chitinophaga vietnamensis TaxID=2593957 RepID=UPI0011786348|nr:FecR domain-containing protein [Chitinophaga vietnamensis]